VQWTYGAVKRLAVKAKMGVGRWDGCPEERIKESHVHTFKPTEREPKSRFDGFIIKDPDFKVFTQPKGTWVRQHRGLRGS
jgi:hypothetical protein